MTELEDDSIALMSKRVYDSAGIIGKNTKIFLNGEQIKVKELFGLRRFVFARRRKCAEGL